MSQWIFQSLLPLPLQTVNYLQGYYLSFGHSKNCFSVLKVGLISHLLKFLCFGNVRALIGHFTQSIIATSFTQHSVDTHRCFTQSDTHFTQVLWTFGPHITTWKPTPHNHINGYDNTNYHPNCLDQTAICRLQSQLLAIPYPSTCCLVALHTAILGTFWTNFV